MKHLDVEAIFRERSTREEEHASSGGEKPTGDEWVCCLQTSKDHGMAYGSKLFLDRNAKPKSQICSILDIVTELRPRLVPHGGTGGGTPESPGLAAP